MGISTMNAVLRERRLAEKTAKKELDPLGKRVKKYKTLLFMLIPGFIFIVIFNYIPMAGISLAFVDLNIKHIFQSEFVGLKHFKNVFTDAYFYKVLGNSLIISVLKFLWGFPVPIIFAIMLNEVRNKHFKRVVQTVSYLPHFISWVVVSSIFFEILSLDGPVNGIVKLFGGDPVMFMSTSSVFRSILVITDIWKGFGWGSIIFFAALCGVNTELYESAELDGANRFQKAVYISIPSIAPIITIMLILSLQGIISAGFDQIFNMYSIPVYDVADIIDTYVYRKGIQEAQYSYTTAIGLFNSLVSITLMIIANKLANLISGGEQGLW